MTASKDEKDQLTQEEQQRTPLRRNQMASHHSLNELLQVAKDMGDQRIIDAIMKKFDE